MTDTLKEFYNGVLTYSQLVDGVAIVANDADTQAFVKEVLVRGTDDHGFSLTIGPTVVCDWVGVGLAAGSEIVPASASMEINTTTRALLNSIASFGSTTLSRVVSLSTLFDDDTTPTTGNSPAVDTAITALSSVSPDFLCIGADGSHYYSARTEGNIYRRAGGPNGAQTTIPFVNVKCWDGERYIYGIHSSSGVWTHDTQTGVTTSVAVSVNPSNLSNNFSRLCAIDGFVVHAGTGSNIEVYDAVTGERVGYATNWTGSGSSQFPMEIGKDSNGNYWVLTLPSSTTAYVADLGPDLSNPAMNVRNGTVPNHNVGAPGGAPYYNALFKIASAPGMLLSLYSNIITLFDITSGAYIKKHTLSGVTISYGFCPILDEAVADSHFGPVSVRSIGVEVT